MPIRRVGRVLNGGTPTSAPENWGGEFPFVTPPDLNGADGAVLESTGRSLSKVGTYGAGIAPPGSVLVSTRAPIGHVGRVAETSAFNQGCRAVVTQRGMEPRYLAAALVAARAELVARGQGTTFLELSSSAFASIPIPIPPSDEQHAISDYLDHETAQIDALVAKQNEFIRLLRERRAALADAEFQQAEEKHAATIRQALVRLDRSPEPGVGVVTAYRDGVVTLRTNRRADGYTMSAAEAGYQGVVPGDIVFHALDGFAGAVGISDSVGQCSPVYHVCRPRYDDDAEYLALLIRYMGTSGFLSTQAPSTRQRSVDFRNWGTFARVPLHLPSPSHQKTFVTEFKRHSARVDVLIAKSEEHIALAKERRAALITAAVTGQFDVRTATKGA
ncbi:restriction endonuclease subunit S [Cryobacterium tepidiphilum]|uniref:Restriction endonuclease subunit S n=1 Tax=Cryobacterium tepidiphilum TaxID=2486026 RepID=A0A3M8LN44_9MICO|nr:restriction endonuclease subunit S [Cryobacterium tepidiphilum]RNE66801.1 restriction endonuclease subunit S [Cryobacterium tepidiphilum]